MVVDDLRAAGDVTKARRVAHEAMHPGQATLVEKIDDQLKLVKTLEVGDIGVVSGVYEGLEASDD